MAPYDQSNTSQQLALAMAPKVTGLLSMLGSGYIISDVIRIGRDQRRTYHRLLCGMSMCDFMVSAGMFMGTWTMPSDTEGVWNPLGNTQTCTAQGFFEQVGVATILYNASLSAYYVTAVTVSRTAQPKSFVLGITKVECFMHFIPWLVGIATMVAGLFLKLFNFGIWDCWIAPYPLDCKQSWTITDGSTTDCVRGDNATLYQWVFFFIPVWIGIIIVTINTVRVFRTVLNQERAVDRWRTGVNSNNEQNRTRSRQVARQSYFYVGALYIAFLPVTFVRIWQTAVGNTDFAMMMLIACTVPLQGFFNCIVYLRPRYIAYQEQKRKQQRTPEEQPEQAGQTAMLSTTIMSTDTVDIKDCTSKDNAAVADAAAGI